MKALTKHHKCLKVLMLITLLYSCYFFYFSSEGLIYSSSNGLIDHVNNLESSGNEDNIFVFPIMGIYFFITLHSIFFKQKSLFWLITGLFVFMISAAFIQMGEMINTIIQGNISLAFVVLIPFLLVVVEIMARFFSKKKD